LGRLAAFKTMVVYYQLLQSFVQRTWGRQLLFGWV
jgi:hypothetical protein